MYVFIYFLVIKVYFFKECFVRKLFYGLVKKVVEYYFKWELLVEKNDDLVIIFLDFINI